MSEIGWIEEKDIEKLHDSYQELVKIIGLQSTLALAEKYQGMSIYLPKLDDALRQIRDEKIRQEFNGGNYRDLAIKYKLTEVWVRQIVNERPVDSGQLSLFDKAV